MPSPFALYPYQSGDRVTLKKAHPCGSQVWLVIRAGADVTLRCEKCGHLTVMGRRALEKATKKVDSPAEPVS